MNNQNNQQVERDKLREIAKVNKKARIGNYKYSQQKSGGGNHSQFRQDQNSRAPGSKSQGSVSGNRTYPTCPKCGQLAVRGLCPWIKAPFNQPLKQITADQNGPSFDPQSIGLNIGEGRQPVTGKLLIWPTSYGHKSQHKRNYVSHDLLYDR
uniref:Gag-pol polyprotein n=1 Tax=Solanum tuberosum TaxID=4113 RepID=M1B9W1_SOLTU